MPASEQYLYRCIETMKADPSLSDETKILMFVEYARLRNTLESNDIKILKNLKFGMEQQDTISHYSQGDNGKPNNTISVINKILKMCE